MVERSGLCKQCGKPEAFACSCKLCDNEECSKFAKYKVHTPFGIIYRCQVHGKHYIHSPFAVAEKIKRGFRDGR